MSLSTPTFTTPSDTCATAAAVPMRITIPPRAMLLKVRLISPPNWLRSDSQESVELFHATADLVFRDHIDDSTVLDEVIPVCKLGHESEVLLDKDHSETSLPQTADHLAESLHDHRGQPFSDLVEEQDPRADAENSGQGQHLLLAAGQAHPRTLATFQEVRKHCVDLLQRHTSRT